MVNEFWKKMDAELDVMSHQQLAIQVTRQTQFQPIHYETELVIFNRAYLQLEVTSDLKLMIPYLIYEFLEYGVETGEDVYTPMFVHRTALLFLRDLFVQFDFWHYVVEYHQNMVTQDPTIPNPTNKPGWAGMAHDKKVLVIFISLYNQHTYLPWEEFGEKLEPLCNGLSGLSKKEWYACFDIAREVIFEKHDKYIDLFTSIDWDKINRDLNTELG